MKKKKNLHNKLKNKISLLEKSYDTYIKIINDYSKEIMKLREKLFTNRKLNVKNLDKSNNLLKEQLLISLFLFKQYLIVLSGSTHNNCSLGLSKI